MCCGFCFCSSKYVLFSLTHGLFRIVVFNFSVFRYFLDYPVFLFPSSIMVRGRTFISVCLNLLDSCNGSESALPCSERGLRRPGGRAAGSGGGAQSRVFLPSLPTPLFSFSNSVGY